jgi:hypothetical protein
MDGRLSREGITIKRQKSFLIQSKLIKSNCLHPVLEFSNFFSKTSLNKVRGKFFFGRSLFKLNMKSTSILAIAIILIMMVSVFASLSTSTQNKPSIVLPIENNSTSTSSPTSQQTASPSHKPVNTPESGSIWNPVTIITTIIDPTPKPAGLIEANPNINTQVWKQVAANAWQYYQPDYGVDRTTGLPKASLAYPYFTDWDLGVYIQAIIDANQTGLNGNEGDWGTNARISKVFTFLETRKLNNASYPFWFYQSSDSENYHAASDLATTNVDVVDSGRLFIALNNLKVFNNTLAPRIDSLVYNRIGNRSNYAILVPGILNDCKSSNSIYTYYYASGFASFWPTDLAGALEMVLTNIGNSGNTTNGLNGISLPNATISCEPLLCSIFELNSNSKLTNLAKQVYLAHEAKYNATGKYVAFSEGNGMTGFIYEWVVLPNGDTWKITKAGEWNYINLEPIIYTKVALSFLALYNTTFARDMNIYLERAFPDVINGYYSGAEYNKDINNANLILSADSNTNGMILGAAKYAIQNNPK